MVLKLGKSLKHKEIISINVKQEVTHTDGHEEIKKDSSNLSAEEKRKKKILYLKLYLRQLMSRKK